MSVERVLDKIAAHNSDVIGCIVSRAGRIFENLPEMYDLVDREDLADKASNIFVLADELQADPAGFDQTFLEFPGYSVFAKRIDDGVLLLLNNPIERGVFKKMQVGVNLFLKPLKRALDEVAAEPVQAENDANRARSSKATSDTKTKRFYRGVEY